MRKTKSLPNHKTTISLSHIKSILSARMFFNQCISSLLLICSSSVNAALRGKIHDDISEHIHRELTSNYCGCVECTQDIFWGTIADGHTCGARVEWLTTRNTEPNYTEKKACSHVAGIEFPEVCGSCNPETCTPIPRGAPAYRRTEPPSVSHCGCEKCTDEIWDRIADDHTCGARIGWMKKATQSTEEDACFQVAGIEFPEICGDCDPTLCNPDPPAPSHCGCDKCTEDVWNKNVNGYTCGMVIEWVQSTHRHFYPSEEHACALVAVLPECRDCDPAMCSVGSNPTLPTNEPTSTVTSTQDNAPESPRGGPLLGSNVIIFGPEMDTSDIQATFDAIYEAQQNNEMGENRHALYFLPGVYGTQDQPLQVRIGYYTEVAGLGSLPTDVQINGKIEVYNRCFEPDPYNESGNFIPTSNDNAVCFALNNFWRSLSNLSVNINSKGQDQCRATANFWAISQASSMRRVDIQNGDLSLMDYCNYPGFASGGYMSDSRAGKVINGSQQQWLSRNLNIAEWSGSVWNQVFVGVLNAPTDNDFPDPPFTTVEKAPVSREKPFLFVDTNGQYHVRVPSANTETIGITWADGSLTSGRTLAISSFYITDPTDSVGRINLELAQGKHIIFTPGVYRIGTSINVELANTVLLGLGQATLTAADGAIPLKIADRPGIIVAGLTIDAGTTESPVLLQVGSPDLNGVVKESDPTNPTTLHDIYFRIGGPHIGKTNIALEINSDNVLVDHTWVWRADHGVENFDASDGFDGDNERWAQNVGRNGVIVNGNDVTALGLFVEHFQEHNVIWAGERGRVYLFQSELAYEPPAQAEWMSSDGTKGWAAYKVRDSVTSHELWGGAVYCYNRNNPEVETDNGFEVPNTPGVRLKHILTRNLSGPGVINSVVNGVGDLVNDENRGPTYVKEYPQR